MVFCCWCKMVRRENCAHDLSVFCCPWNFGGSVTGRLVEFATGKKRDYSPRMGVGGLGSEKP